MAAQWIQLLDVPSPGDTGFLGWLYADPTDAAVMASHDFDLPLFTRPDAPAGTQLECLALRANYDEWKRWCSGGFSGLGKTYPLPFPLPNLTSEDIDPIGVEAGNAAWGELQPKLEAEIEKLVRRAHREAPSIADEAFTKIRPSGEAVISHQVDRLLVGVAVLTGAFIGGMGYLALSQRKKS